MKNKIQSEYFEWMYKLVLGVGYPRTLSYKKLMRLLNNIEFTYILERDESRAIDGVDLRYRFGSENGYPSDVIDQNLGYLPCSVFEMMVALAYRLEDQFMDDYDYGNRTGQWFWNMIVSLGLGSMSDSKFDKRYVEDVIFRFLRREYEPNGEGGLFTLKDCKYDLREEEIWYQAMWYLNENFDFSL